VEDDNNNNRRDLSTKQVEKGSIYFEISEGIDANR
jgi:hypothetical protein